MSIRRGDSDAVTGLSCAGPSVTEREGNAVAMLAWLNVNRNLDGCRSIADANDRAFFKFKSLGEPGSDAGIVVPGDLADRIGQFVQPGIV